MGNKEHGEEGKQGGKEMGKEARGREKSRKIKKRKEKNEERKEEGEFIIGKTMAVSGYEMRLRRRKEMRKTRGRR